jgi:hypothetical protein
LPASPQATSNDHVFLPADDPPSAQLNKYITRIDLKPLGGASGVQEKAGVNTGENACRKAINPTDNLELLMRLVSHQAAEGLGRGLFRGVSIGYVRRVPLQSFSP